MFSIMLGVVVLSMLSAVMLSVVILNVVAPSHLLIESQVLTLYLNYYLKPTPAFDLRLGRNGDKEGQPSMAKIRKKIRKKIGLQSDLKVNIFTLNGVKYYDVYNFPLCLPAYLAPRPQRANLPPFCLPLVCPSMCLSVPACLSVCCLLSVYLLAD